MRLPIRLAATAAAVVGAASCDLPHHATVEDLRSRADALFSEGTHGAADAADSCLARALAQITSQLEASTQDGPGEAVLIDELTVMKKRMTLVKYALFLCGVAFIFNLAALYLGYFSPGGLEPAMMALTILSMVGGISCFCVETVLSTKALNLHISGVLHRDATGPDGRA